ncbi:alpha-glucan family phosphorylase [Marinilabiliaceae bacterium ANBcel2]|nr:alpha-glucan family phosphorylase [Marinilabiliaceae bacterium ANBcel2]
MGERLLKPDYLFETGWEICNKTGGVHTVLASKVDTLVQEFGDKAIFVGPDVVRGVSNNPEFIPDDTVFASWQYSLLNEGLRVRCGRWNIPGKPLVLLVDFTPYVAEKNRILSYLWETYKVDSIYGKWDYIEPVLFGYAAGAVIESFYRFHLTVSDKIVTHFNEWTSGTGALYLKDKLPQAATVFTAHSTVLGRSLAGSGHSLYSELHEFDAEAKAQDLGVIAKHSLESKSAFYADTFTTLSEITARECSHFFMRKPDIITPDGFGDIRNEDSRDAISIVRNRSRSRFKEVASAVMGRDVPDNALFVASSGRYEYRNKGTDLLLDALELLNSVDTGCEIFCFVLIPANSYGPRHDLIERLSAGEHGEPLCDSFLTHGLHDIGYDPIINRIRDIHLNNNPEDNVKLFFVPAYLDGDDGIFNIPYFELMAGADLTLFPAYYEPWGYTSVESISLGVPAVTTSLSGFGQWVKSKTGGIIDGVAVIERDDFNYNDAVNSVAEEIKEYSKCSLQDRETIRKKSIALSEELTWPKFIDNYYKAYDIALGKVNSRREKFSFTVDESPARIVPDFIAEPSWKKIVVKSKLPEKISFLQKLVRNLWWTWNYEAVELFEYIDRVLWQELDKNPVKLLGKVSYERLEELSNDESFISRLADVEVKFNSYMARPLIGDSPSIAYFSMEYGINDVLKIFSGGLGILAGDYLKEASDKGVNMVAVGLMYRYGYFRQSLTVFGEQTASYDVQEFSNLPVEEVRGDDGERVMVKVDFPGREVNAIVWKACVGKVPLYLMDTDIPQNASQDREITHMLYGGGLENRLKQEILLGIGGVRLLNAVGIESDLYHCNEGHAAFINVERLIEYTSRRYSFAEAMELVRASSLFTTHTPVPAGHDKFDEDLLRIYMRHIPEKLRISWKDFISMGRETNSDSEEFSMSVLAAKTSQEMNGVSLLHGEVSREMFKNLWRGYFPSELHIKHVTNGVHYGTWTSNILRRLYEGEFSKEFLNDVSDSSVWQKIYEVSDQKIWEVRKVLKKKLIDYIKRRLERGMTQRHESPSHSIEVLESIREDALTIGFARRFATYKRANLLFRDIERLKEIVNNEEHPVQFLFAGKAHPADDAGQALIKHIVEVSRRPEFVGKIIFLENYDMDFAKRLVSGVDVWLNTPTRPQEASGTSGEKAELNGVLNFSVLDGWWYEGYREGAGWALSDEQTYDNGDYQNDLDALTIYSILENEIIPTYFDVDKNGISAKWISYIKKSVSEIAPHYTTRRMMDDYCKKFYYPMKERLEMLVKEDYRAIREIAFWKRKVLAGWDSIEVLSIDMPDIGKKELGLGELYSVKVVLDLKQLADVDIGVELVVVEAADEKDADLFPVKTFKVAKKEGTKLYYTLDYKLKNPGVFRFGIRIYPRHDLLRYRQDFALVKWI